MTTTATKPDFYSVINERHSVKKYDASHKMTKEEIHQLLEDSQKAPSAWNLQHWKFLVLESDEAKAKALPIAYGQQQVADASIVVCILADTEANKNADPVFEEAVQKGYMPREVKDSLIQQIEGAYTIPDMGKDQALMNSSLSAMQLMLVAKGMGYDTCAMGGFDRQKMTEEFHIPSRYIPTMLISVGKAAEAAYPSTRFQVEDVTIWETF
ncbi:nitroreductase family protein [Cytobacillus spongiae]|uniref:nitroreductase family protein n=1 Tax=Cytobacillus spongiae TaxID=2901381 RepID=UPI001F41F418|nr:nitroreductase family protein [Cytobacillus spongiae]UII57731.1 nitroreductase family protein [Cytobacillus spongiae]